MLVDKECFPTRLLKEDYALMLLGQESVSWMRQRPNAGDDAEIHPPL